MDFKFPVAECDVREAEWPRIERFREQLCTWHEWLFDDEHAIWGQIHSMLWNSMLFETINECRRLAEEAPSPNVGFNRDIAGFIDRSYAANQLLAIRRLTEANDRSDAITLPRLLNDMKANADLFTRELYVCYDGLPFDPEPVMRRVVDEGFASSRENGGMFFRWGDRTGPDAYDSSYRTHENFDRLIGVDGNHRTREEALSVEIFDKARSQLGVCSAVNRVASKFIAHAADASSRSQLDDLSERERNVTFAKIEACQRMICRVTAYISGPILFFGATTLIPTPQYDHLEHLDMGWLDPANLDAIAQHWNERTRKVEGWIDGGWDKLLKLPG